MVLTLRSSCYLLGRIVPAAILMTVSSASHADILFSAKTMGPVTNIYSIDEQTGETTEITANRKWRDLYIDITDGGWLTFISDRRTSKADKVHKRPNNFNAYLIKTDGAGLLRLSNSDSHVVSPKFGPDGQKLAYIQQTEPNRLIYANRDGTEAEPVATADRIFDFTWAPDGENIAVAQQNGDSSSLENIDLKHGDSSQLLKVSAAQPRDDSSASAQPAQLSSVQWSPDGDKLAYIRHPLTQDSRQLRVLHLKSGEDQLISDKGVQVQHPVHWSRNSRQLLYSGLIGYDFEYDTDIHKKVYKGSMHIFVSDLDGENRKLTRGNALYKAPVFSPDENRIAFLYADRLEARTLTLRTMNSDGKDIKELFDSVTKRSHLTWY